MKLLIYCTTLIILVLPALSKAADYTIQEEYKLKTILGDTRYPPVPTKPDTRDWTTDFLDWLDSLLPEFGNSEKEIEEEPSNWLDSLRAFFDKFWDLMLAGFKFAFWIGVLYVVYRIARVVIPFLMNIKNERKIEELGSQPVPETPIDISKVNSPIVKLKLLRDLIRSNLARKHLVPLSKTDREFSKFIDTSTHPVELKTLKLHEGVVYSGKPPSEFEINELANSYLDE